MTRLALAVATALLGACSAASVETPPMPVSFDAIGAACDGADSCINAGVREERVNGVRVVHRPLPGAPIASIRVLLDGGARRWTPRGVQAEAVLFRIMSWWGSAERIGPAFDAAVARIGGRFSAGQGLDFAAVSMAAPVAHFDTALTLVAEAVRAPPIPETDDGLDHVKGVQKSQLEARYEEPAQAASQTAWDMIYGGHPYNLGLESIDEVDAVRVDDVVAAADALRRGDRMTVVIVGDVPWEHARGAVELRLRALDAHGEAQPLPPVTPSARRAEVLDFPDAPNWHVRGYFPAPAATDTDYLPLLLGLFALDDRLFDELRTARGLVYTAGASLGNYRANYGSVWLSTDHPAEALAAFHDVLAAIQRDGPEPHELEAARAQYLTAFLANADTAAGMSWTLGAWLLTSDDRTLADAHIAALEDVTLEQMADALRRYLPEVRLAAAGAGEPLTEAMLVGAAAP